MLKWFKDKTENNNINRDQVINLRWYPGRRGNAKNDLKNIRPEELPPLMVRKPAWRR